MKKVIFCFVFIFSMAIVFSSAHAENEKYKDCYKYRAINMGSEQQARSDFEKAIQLEPNNARANYCLGIYHNSLGKYEDCQKAVDYYRKALKSETGKGNIELIKKALGISLYNIGMCWKDGREVPKDDLTSFIYFFEAANIGNRNAQFELGSIYSAGIVGSSDKVRAYMWWNLAAAQEHYQASIRRDLITVNMTEEEVEQAQRMSFKFISESGKKEARPNVNQ